jgi:hypothetical protein
MIISGGRDRELETERETERQRDRNEEKNLALDLHIRARNSQHPPGNNITALPNTTAPNHYTYAHVYEITTHD